LTSWNGPPISEAPLAGGRKAHTIAAPASTKQTATIASVWAERRGASFDFPFLRSVIASSAALPNAAPPVWQLRRERR
jgi:hypothetical protein